MFVFFIMYYIHWKSLFVLGFVFWILLCLTDILGDPKLKYMTKYCSLKDVSQDPIVEDIVEKKLNLKMQNIEEERMKFGWPLVMWYIKTFIFSVISCALARTLSWLVWGLYKHYRNKKVLKEVQARETLSLARSISSKIPVLISKSTTTIKSVDEECKTKGSLDLSCPNLLDLEKQFPQRITSQPCETLFKNKLFIQGITLDRHLQTQCAKLREEMLIVQATSLREHGVLSRKLEAVTKEKKELSKQLAVAQKENRAAKQQLEELLNEKSMLQKRLENATKEFKNNTKSKKVALAKLEEITAHAEILTEKLEQVSRDKEILEGKLRLLECEYEKLKDRLRTYQASSAHLDSYMGSSDPERDENIVSRDKKCSTLSLIKEASIKESKEGLPTVSETEIDIKKIQMKILQLERDLENFNPQDYVLRNNGSLRAEIDNDNREIINYDRNDTRMERPMRLNNIQETNETASEFSSTEDINKSRRIVSSSAAFQNFLKNLNSDPSRKLSVHKNPR